MIEPVEREILLPNGEPRSFIIHKFDAISGREIVTQYPISGMPKIGEYKVNEEIMFKLMAFVSVRTGETKIALQTRELIKQHVPDWETLARLEWAVMEYNCSFFANGKASSFLDDLLTNIPASITSILIHLSEQLSQRNTPPSES